MHRLGVGWSLVGHWSGIGRDWSGIDCALVGRWLCIGWVLVGRALVGIGHFGQVLVRRWSGTHGAFIRIAF